MNKSVITLEIEDATPEMTMRLQKTIHMLIVKGALSLRNGTVTLSFDHNAELGSIKFDAIVWRRDKVDTPLHNSFKSGTITQKARNPNMGGKLNSNSHERNSTN
jgi:hypothetical protein